MTGMDKLMKLLLLTSLLTTGVRCGGNATVFVYSTLGGEALLPCIGLASTQCSTIDWTFFKGGKVYNMLVREGQVVADSDKARRITIMPNCSMILRDLITDDAASYVCEWDQQTITASYLSLLTISSPSTVTGLQPGGNLVLSCVLFTYYDAGSCKSYSAGVFRVSWQHEDGTEVKDDGRYRVMNSYCNSTLTVHLQEEDNNRRWTCQVNSTKSSSDAFLHFQSSFLLHSSRSRHSLNPPAESLRCAGPLPISHIVLCVALPLMVGFVGFYTWRLDHRRAKLSAAAI